MLFLSNELSPILAGHDDGPAVPQGQTTRILRRRRVLNGVAFVGLAVAGIACCLVAFSPRGFPGALHRGAVAAVALFDGRVSECHDTRPGEDCHQGVVWGQAAGITLEPGLFPGLTAESPARDFQMALHRLRPSICPMPCSVEEAEPAPLGRGDQPDGARSTPGQAEVTEEPAEPRPSAHLSLIDHLLPPRPMIGRREPAPTAHPATTARPRPRTTSRRPSTTRPWTTSWRLSTTTAWSWSTTRPSTTTIPPPTVATTAVAEERLPAFVLPTAPLAPQREAIEEPIDTTLISPDTGECYPPKVLSDDGLCHDSVGPATMTFYMYRAQGNRTDEIENINTASLAGVMWYLHNEVIASVPRKYHITRIIRLRVTMRNTQNLYDHVHRQFGPFVAFDAGRAPGRNVWWSDYGFVVGCQLVDLNLYGYSPPPSLSPACFPSNSFVCRAGKWYSLPGPCPEQSLRDKSPQCVADSPGGRCSTAHVTGERDCTYYVEFAGEVFLDELEGIEDYNLWWIGHDEKGGVVPNGKREYDPATDRGVGMSFWDGKLNKTACTERMDAVTRIFQAKYPEMPGVLPEPFCN